MAVQQPSCSPWGAIILGSSFLSYMLNGGVFCTNGLLLPSFLLSFGAGEVATTWLASVQVGLCMCSGLVSGVMVELYGCRFVAILGSSIASVGYICSAFVSDIRLMYITYSVMPGLGLGLQFVPCLVVIQYYFVERRTLAAGITTSGSSTGVFLYSLICQLFLNIFGYRGTLLLNGAIMLHGIPFGILMTSHPKTQWRPGMTPLQTEPPEIKIEEEDNVISEENENKAFTPPEETALPRGPAGSPCNGVVSNGHIDTGVLQPGSPGSGISNGHVNKMLSNGNIQNGHVANGKISHHGSPNGLVSNGNLRKTRFVTSVQSVGDDSNASPHKSSSAIPCNGTESPVMNKNVNRLMVGDRHASHSLPQLTHTGLYRRLSVEGQAGESSEQADRSVSHSNVFNDQQSPRLAGSTDKGKRDLRLSVLLKESSIRSPPLPPLDDEDLDMPPVEPEVKRSSLLSELGRTFKGVALGFMELRRPACLLTFLSNFCACFGYQVPYLFLPTKAVLLGYEMWSGAFLISVIGMSDTAGRLFFGWMGNCIPKHVPVIYSLGMLLSGIGTAGSGLMTSYQGMVAFSIANGLGTGCFVSLNPQTVVEILGFDKIARFIGLMGLATGIAFFLSPTTSALVYKATGNISDPFYFGASFQMAGALILIIYRFTPYYANRPGAIDDSHGVHIDDLGDGEPPVVSREPSFIGSVVSRLDSHQDLALHSSTRSRLDHAGITLVPMYGSTISVNTMRSEPTHG